VLFELVTALSDMGRKKIEKDWNELIVEPFAEPNPQPLAAWPSLDRGTNLEGTLYFSSKAPEHLRRLGAHSIEATLCSSPPRVRVRTRLEL
jgi:hypothetical protein